MNKPVVMSYKHKHWLSFGITEQDYTALAYLVDAVGKKGIKMHSLMGLRDKDGLEAIFDVHKKPVVLNLATNGNARLEFYRSADRGPELTTGCGDIRQKWQDIARMICNFR
jgi:hypothetical protein